MDFTGERIVPGKVEPDLWAEHASRYVFAAPLVAGRRVLDLGTGAGYGAQALAERAKSVVGVDISVQAVRYATAHHAAARASFGAASAHALPFRSGTFDAVVCFEVIEHVHEQQQLLAEVRRVLAPDGIFIVSTPNRLYYSDERHEHNEFHVKEFELAEFLDFLRPVFPHVELYLQNHAPAVVIDRPNGSAVHRALLARSAQQAADAALRTAHYGVAICAAQPLGDMDGVVFFPEGSGNVLREREKHIKALQSHLESTARAFDELKGDWEERGKWTRKLDEQLAQAQKAHEKLAAEQEERTRWAQSLEAELRTSQREYQRLDGEFEERSQQFRAALASADELRARLAAVQGELSMARAEALQVRSERDELAALRKQIDSNTRRLHEAEAAQRTLQAQLDELRGGPSAARQGAALARKIGSDVLRLAGRTALPFFAAGAAVPLAAAVGAGALAAEAAARLLPRRPRLPAAAPLDTTLATIAILNFDGRDLLLKNVPHCLRAIELTGKPHELLVIDNGSTDGSVELLREQFPEVKVVALPRNLFFSRGYDAGLHAAAHDIVVLLNNDMRVEPDFLEPLLQPFRGDDRVFAVASEILMAGKRREETGLTRGRFAGGRFEFRHDPVPAGSQSGPVPILWAGGGAAAFDKRKFFEIGGLDRLYDPFYCEDADLSLRAWRRGWKVLFTPESKVWHDHRTTSRRVFGEDFVNETVRRNTLLLHWANLTDRDLLGEHLARLPALAFDQARQHGLSGLRSLAKAAARAPRALARRLREREDGPSLREIFEKTEAGADPAARRLPKWLAPDEKLRVVMVSPYHVYPVQHGGAVRMYNVLRELSRRGHDVSLVGFVDNDEQLRAGEEHLGKICGEVRLLKRTGRPRTSFADSLPAEVVEFDDAALHRELRSVIEGRDVDVVQVEYTHMAPFGVPSDRHVTCITEHDVAFVSLYRQALAAQGRIDRALAHARYLKMFRYELQALAKFDAVFAVTRRDAELLRGYLGDGVFVSDRAPTGADTAAMLDVPRAPQGESILFVGNFEHVPNVDAVRYLAEQVLPEVWKRAPDVRVTIAGRSPTDEIKALARDPRVTVTGYVPDLGAIYAAAGAFVSPVRVAAGVRVKLLEAFAAGVPVVSTTMGAEGIDLQHEREVLLADTPAAIAEQTLRALRDRELAGRLSAAGRKLAQDRYSWPTIAANLEDDYREALRRKGLMRRPS